MSLIGWVSDETYSALSDVAVEVARDGVVLAQVRSSPSGRLEADVPAGRYQLALAHPGHGSKRVNVQLGPAGAPLQLRLLSDRMSGFVWPRWVKSGDQAELRFHSVEPYRLSLWRYGADKESLGVLGWFDEHGPRAVMQITPDGDYTQTGVAWNQVGYGGNPHHSLMVRAPERGGLHYIHAETESGAFFSAPWIVAPERPTSPLAVLHSTNTWNAYNNFGGRSNYINPAGLPPQPTVNARQDLDRYDEEAMGGWGAPNDVYLPLSFERPEAGNVVRHDERPTDPMRGRLESSMAPAEWRLLAWLEREEFSYDCYSDQQLHDGTLDLSAYRALIITVHPEYWTRAMFDRVSEWVGGGGRLVSLGGNSINCEVELSDGRAMRCLTYLGSADGPLGMPDPGDPSIWYDSRFHYTAAPEAALLGLATTDSGIMTAAPYEVLDGSHWIFSGSGLAKGDTFGAASLHERCSGGASGHETDKRTAETPASFRILAKGLNPDEGGAEIVVEERPDGGLVFAVGSITWVASLLVDEAVSTITRNVIERSIESPVR